MNGIISKHMSALSLPEALLWVSQLYQHHLYRITRRGIHLFTVVLVTHILPGIAARSYVSGIHLGSKTVHSYDSNTSGKLSVQAKIHSQIDDSRLDELSKSVTLLSSSVELAKSGNASLTPGASAKICGRLPTKPLKSICASTQQAEEPVNISITNITDMFISEETKQSGSKEAPQISDAFTGVHRSGSIRKSAALAFRTSDAQTEARLSVGSRSQH